MSSKLVRPFWTSRSRPLTIKNVYFWLLL